MTPNIGGKSDKAMEKHLYQSKRGHPIKEMPQNLDAIDWTTPDPQNENLIQVLLLKKMGTRKIMSWKKMPSENVWQDVQIPKRKETNLKTKE